MVPVYGESEYLLRCIKSILKFTPDEILVYICDDASPLRSTEEFLETEGIPTEKIVFIRREVNLGFLENCNLFFSEVRENNIVLVNSDVLVSSGWLESLMKPIEMYSNVATVTAMTNSGSIATVKLGAEELAELDEESLEILNVRLNSSVYPINAEIPVGVGHCILFSAKALAIVGMFDPIFSPGYGEEVDFSIRATQYGFQHYLANTVVTHFGSKTFGEKSTILKDMHNKILEGKHPTYLELVSSLNVENSQIEAMFLNVFIKLRGLKLLIDARLMHPQATGTSRLIENTIFALSELGNIQVTVLLYQHSLDYWRDKLPQTVELVSKSLIRNSGQIFDVVYSPSQISDETTISEYRFWARRIVILQLDLISFDNWKYFSSFYSHQAYKKAILRTYAESDAILYISRYVKGRAERIFDRSRENDKVIYCGVDHFPVVSHEEFQTNRILVIGAGFAHKNQMYAIKLFDLLKKDLPDVKIVFVGPKPNFGYEQDFLNLVRDNASNHSIEFHDWLPDDELKNQMIKAQLVLYPSTSEGFGFIPFEAVKMKRASIFNLNTSLKELFGEVPSKLVYSPVKDAETIFKLLSDEKSYDSQVNYIDKVSQNYTWKGVGITLEDTFNKVALVKRLNTYRLGIGKDIKFDWRYHFLRDIGSQKFVLMVFPFNSRRRIYLVSKLMKRFL
jgi:GT2 family glycosyltransferase